MLYDSGDDIFGEVFCGLMKKLMEIWHREELGFLAFIVGISAGIVCVINFSPNILGGR